MRVFMVQKGALFYFYACFYGIESHFMRVFMAQKESDQNLNNKKQFIQPHPSPHTNI
jgi:hypothetical protein